MPITADRLPDVQRIAEQLFTYWTGQPKAQRDVARVLNHLRVETGIDVSSAAYDVLGMATPPRRGRLPSTSTGTIAERLARPYCRLNPHMMTTIDLASSSGDAGIPTATVYFWRKGQHDHQNTVGSGGFLLPRHDDTGDQYAATREARLPNHVAYQHARSRLYMFHAWAWGRERWAALLERESLSLCPFAFRHGCSITPATLSGREAGSFFAEPALGDCWQHGWSLAMQFRAARQRIGISPAIRRRGAKGGYVTLFNPGDQHSSMVSIGDPLRQIIWDEITLHGGTPAEFEALEGHAESLNRSRAASTQAGR